MLKIKPKSFILQWHITERCNWHCRHCYQEDDKLPPDLNLEQLFLIFNQYLFLIKKWQISPAEARLNITGGEPLIRKDFFKLVEKISQYSHLFRWGILSNGSLLDENNVLKLKKADLRTFQVSLEGMEKNNDQVRGKGTFKKTISAIKILTGAGIRVVVSLTLTKKNMDDVPVLAKLCDKLGVEALGTRRLLPWGRGKTMKEGVLQPRELRNFYLKVKEINKKLAEEGKRFRIVLGCESGIFNKELPINSLSNMKPSFCAVTQGRIITIMANADILPCRRFPIVVGNALKKNIYEVFYSKKMQEFRSLDKLHPFCRECPDFVDCFGGAKCVNYAYAEKWDIPDVQCRRAYKKLNQPKFT